MSVQSRTTLKSYFMSGATLDESDFADLIDSSLLAEDLITSLTSNSSVLPLSASVGSELNTKISNLSARVDAVEDEENTFSQGYYNKSEVDAQILGVDNYINALPYAGQIHQLQLDVSGAISLAQGKADSVHNQPISTVTGLQEALDQKATVDNLNSVRDSLIASINSIEKSDETAEVASLQTAVDQINATITDLATKDELSLLVGPDHDHLVEDLDLSGYYTKSQVDTKIDEIIVPPHTHGVSEINGLGQEVQDKAQLLVQDHTNLTNPHGVTKEQIGLDKVENMTPSEIVSSAGGLTTEGIDAVEARLDLHLVTGNPHNINKTHVGLGNVPNVNVEQLLTAHLADENPHNVDISTFDIYTTSQADQRIRDYINDIKYEFTPQTNDDSAGDVGDFAYDNENLYFKIRATEWAKLPFSPVYNEEVVDVEKTATQEDVDAGLATEVGDTIIIQEIIQNSEVIINEVQNISVTNNFSISDEEGTPVFEIGEGNNIIQAPTTIDNLSIKGNELATEQPLTISAPQFNISNTYITGGEITNVTNVTTQQITSPIANVTNVTSEDITTAEFKTSSFNFYNDSGNSTDLRYDFTDSRWKTSTSTGDKVIAYTSDSPDLSPYALKSDIPSNIGPGKGDGTDGANVTDTVINATTGGLASGYAFNEDGGLYADDPDQAGDQEYWTYETEGIDTTGFVINIGVGVNNPSLKYNYQESNWEFFDGNITVPVRTGASLSEAEIDAKIAGVVDSAPSTLNTLNELAAALGDDANFATTTANSLGKRVRVDTSSQGLSNTEKTNARTNIGAQVAGSYASSSHNHDGTYASSSHNHDGTYAPASHNHDGRYYTENEVNTLLANLKTELEAKFYAI